MDIIRTVALIVGATTRMPIQKNISIRGTKASVVVSIALLSLVAGALKRDSIRAEISPVSVTLRTLFHQPCPQSMANEWCDFIRYGLLSSSYRDDCNDHKKSDGWIKLYYDDVTTSRDVRYV